LGIDTPRRQPERAHRHARQFHAQYDKRGVGIRRPKLHWAENRTGGIVGNRLSWCVLATTLFGLTAVYADLPSRIAEADKEPGNWLTTGRTYDESRDSPLTRINDRNAGQLGLAWYYDLDTDRGQESTPLAVDGVLYTTSAWSKVQAFDPVSGKLLWRFDPEVPRKTGVKSCCDSVNRGAAYWNRKIYVGTIDGRLIAIDAKTGRQVWQERLRGPFSASPVYAGGRVYFFNEEGMGYVVQAGREWKLLATNRLPDGCMASPAVAGRSLFVRTRTQLFCFTADNAAK